MPTLFIDHQTHDRIVFNSVVRRDSYTDTVPLEMQLPKYSVALISSALPGIDGPIVVAVGAFRRSIRVTSYQRRYEISDTTILDRPIPLRQLTDRVPPQNKTHVAPALTGRHVIPDGSSSALTHVIDNLDPECAELIRRAARRPTSIDAVTAARRFLLSEERDTFGLIAEISGLGRDAKARGRRLVAPVDEVDPNRTYLETVRLSYNDEEALSTSDLGRFDGVLGRPARRSARGMVIRHPTGNITVLNTNNKDLEHTRGCDLVYYHTGRKAGLVVQYKRMDKDSGDMTDDTKWVYRGDKQLAKELDRMRSTTVDTRNADVPGYRLNHQPHYLKIVRPTDYDGQSMELMKGLYLPLDLVDLMHESADDTTPHGNLRITWEDKRWPTQRYMNNTTFTQLFRDGWIGSCGTTSDDIRRWIEPMFDADELVTVVIAENS